MIDPVTGVDYDAWETEAMRRRIIKLTKMVASLRKQLKGKQDKKHRRKP